MTAPTLTEPEAPEIAPLPCPPWCDGQCDDGLDYRMHSAPTVAVPVTPEFLDVTDARVEVEMSVVDEGGTFSDTLISIFMDKAGAALNNHAGMSPAQARAAAAALVRAADIADGLVTAR